MKKISSLFLCVSLLASSPFAQISSSDQTSSSSLKSPRDLADRKFSRDAKGVILANIEVAYETGTNAPAASKIENYLSDVFRNASKQLYQATSERVMLGTVTIKPKEQSNDPDIMISNSCNGEKPYLVGSETVQDFCADAHTGGYLGTQYWLPLVAQGTPSYNAYQVDQGSRLGSHITISWATLNKYDLDFTSELPANDHASVLTHELGHYLFAMRDEYEWYGFSANVDDQTPGNQNGDLTIASLRDIYLYANGINPKNNNGFSLEKSYLTNAGNYESPNTPLTSSFANSTSVMGRYDPNSATTEYSPAIMLFTSSQTGVIQDPFTLKTTGYFWFLEQVGSVATRGSSPKGGMFNLQLSLNTTFNEQVAIPSAPSFVAPTIQFAKAPMGIVFILDKSNSMTDRVDPNISVPSRWATAINAMGELVHKGASTETPEGDWSGLNYDFGLLTFATSHTIHRSPASGISAIQDYFTRNESDKSWVANPDHTNPLPSTPWGRSTNINGVLDQAGIELSSSSMRLAKNVILFSDGEQNDPTTVLDLTTPRDFKVNIFAIARQETNDKYGTDMQALANKTGGEIVFVSGKDFNKVIADGIDKLMLALNAQVTMANQTSSLTLDRLGFPLTLSSDMKKTSFVITWAGADEPVLQVCNPHGICYAAGSTPQVSLTRTAPTQYTITLYPAIAALGTYTINASSPTAEKMSVVTRINVEETDLTFIPEVDVSNTKFGGNVPVGIRVTHKGEPVAGLQVQATLRNDAVNTNQTISLILNGNTYRGEFSTNLFPGVCNLTFRVVHPNNNLVRYVSGENNSSTNLPAQVSYFAPRNISQSLFLAGGQNTRAYGQLKAYTKMENPGFMGGTRLRLYLDNKTKTNLTGLKARYYFSTSEHAGFNAITTANNLAATTQLRLGQVASVPNLHYVEFDLGNKTILAGQDSRKNQPDGDGVILSFSDWSNLWDRSNDFSAKNLDDNWKENDQINIYDANGVLLAGSSWLDGVAQPANLAPEVTIEFQDTYAKTGESVRFSASGNDPEDGPYGITYQWSINGVDIAQTSSGFSTSFAVAGTYRIGVRASDAQNATNYAEISIEVQDENESPCSGSTSMGAMNSSQQITLPQGSSCFTISSDKLPTSWAWAKVMMQISAADGISLNDVQVTPYGSLATELSGWSIPVSMPDPGFGKNLQFKITTSVARTIRANWWVTP